MARGEATDKSDIDLIVRFASRKSLLAVANLAIQIEDATGRKVDLLTERSISPHIRERVKKDLRVVYELG